ncbi:uncharacterized protein LOC130621621 isoform X2 [Hydractinia symbiolongicarpus]|uniref:uncharacterized protein LOC130621621 isoform X2 n=1 Tax=Hydractinia symbiolongicarpus TaxID=13093 RepID=UPI00254ED361|nr:uncharacterized protein LOC130621621 isoform X2 [Hydractinia symbiolongicarpus]
MDFSQSSQPVQESLHSIAEIKRNLQIEVGNLLRTTKNSEAKELNNKWKECLNSYREKIKERLCSKSKNQTNLVVKEEVLSQKVHNSLACSTNFDFGKLKHLPSLQPPNYCTSKADLKEAPIMLQASPSVDFTKNVSQKNNRSKECPATQKVQKNAIKIMTEKASDMDTGEPGFNKHLNSANLMTTKDFINDVKISIVDSLKKISVVENECVNLRSVMDDIVNKLESYEEKATHFLSDLKSEYVAEMASPEINIDGSSNVNSKIDNVNIDVALKQQPQTKHLQSDDVMPIEAFPLQYKKEDCEIFTEDAESNETKNKKRRKFGGNVENVLKSINIAQSSSKSVSHKSNICITRKDDKALKVRTKNDPLVTVKGDDDRLFLISDSKDATPLPKRQQHRHHCLKRRSSDPITGDRARKTKTKTTILLPIETIEHTATSKAFKHKKNNFSVASGLPIDRSVASGLSIDSAHKFPARPKSPAVEHSEPSVWKKSTTKYLRQSQSIAHEPQRKSMLKEINQSNKIHHNCSLTKSAIDFTFVRCTDSEGFTIPAVVSQTVITPTDNTSILVKGVPVNKDLTTEDLNGVELEPFLSYSQVVDEMEEIEDDERDYLLENKQKNRKSWNIFCKNAEGVQYAPLVKTNGRMKAAHKHSVGKEGIQNILDKRVIKS